MEHTPIFRPYESDEKEKALLDKDGHFLLPGILTPGACERLMASFSHILDLLPSAVEGHKPSHFAAEYDAYLESLIPHPQMLDLARRVLGKEIRFDHCVTMIRREATEARVGTVTNTPRTIRASALCASFSTSAGSRLAMAD